LFLQGVPKNHETFVFHLGGKEPGSGVSQLLAGARQSLILPDELPSFFLELNGNRFFVDLRLELLLEGSAKAAANGLNSPWLPG
jgi:hypothetical protein